MTTRRKNMSAETFPLIPKNDERIHGKPYNWKIKIYIPNLTIMVLPCRGKTESRQVVVVNVY